MTSLLRVISPAVIAVSLAIFAGPAAAQGLPSGLQEKAQDAAMDQAKKAAQEKAEEMAKEQLKEQMGGAGLPGSSSSMPDTSSAPSVPGGMSGAKSKLP